MALQQPRYRFTLTVNKAELEQTVAEIIPISQEKYRIITVDGSLKDFKVTIECDIPNTAEFIQNYSSKSKETLRRMSSKHPSEQNPFSKYEYFRCQHKTYCESTMDHKNVLRKNPSKRFRNKNCPFSMVIKHRKDLNEFGQVLEIEWTHNHPTQSLQSMSFRDISEHTRVSIMELFEKGYTPSLAYKEVIRDVKSKCNNELEYHVALSYRSEMPRG